MKNCAGLLCFCVLFCLNVGAFASERLSGSEWGFEGNDDVFIQFQTDNKLIGYGGCNRFFGGYQIGAGGNIQIGPIGATRKLCHGDGVMALEQSLLMGLEKAEKYMRKGTSLKFFDESNDQIFVLRQRDWD